MNRYGSPYKNPFIKYQKARLENFASDIAEADEDVSTFKPLGSYLDDFCDSICDSWGLDALCSEVSEHSDPDDLMNVTDNRYRDKHTVLRWAAQKLLTSPTARMLLHEAEKEGWSVMLDSLDGPDFHMDVPQKLIILDNQNLSPSALVRSDYFKNGLLVTLIRALRDIWQEKRHGAFDENYAPEHVLMLERIRAADLDVMSVLVAWELRACGNGDIWRHLIGSNDGDIAMRFSGYLERDPSCSVFTGKALFAAFQQWFNSDARINACDHETLNYLDAVVQDQLEGIHHFGDAPLRAVDIEILSCLPDRTAYLQGQGQDIMRNPKYAGLNDEINQAHFMQILYDLKVTLVQDVPFRDADLAGKIFPNGQFTPETEDLPN